MDKVSTTEKQSIKRKTVAMLVCAALAFVCVFVVLMKQEVTQAISSDNDPPIITNISVDSVTGSSSVISWVTDEPSDSIVNFGLDKRYGLITDPIPNKKNHSLYLTDLFPGTAYYFRVMSTDESGNRNISGDFLFTTKGTSGLERVSNEKQVALSKEIMDLLSKITDPIALAAIAKKLEEQGQKITEAPKIVGHPKIDDLGSDFAVIIWQTDKAANSVVELAEEKNYSAESDNPYNSTQGELEEQVTEHRVHVSGLVPGTVYHFRVSSKGEIGPTGVSLDDTFTTKSLLPEIRSFILQKVQEDSATFLVMANIPTSASVEYTNERTREVKSKGDPTLLTTHTIQLNNLVFGASYSAIAKIENEAGDKTVSKPTRFVTARDATAPAISKVTNESTLFPGEETKIQTIVSWETDEPTTCRFSFHMGIAAGPKDESESSEWDANPTLTHVQVITALTPSSVYKFWIECKDRSGNDGRSEDFVLITPEKEKSIIDVIIENFSGTFGWVKNIGGKK